MVARKWSVWVERRHRDSPRRRERLSRCHLLRVGAVAAEDTSGPAALPGELELTPDPSGHEYPLERDQSHSANVRAARSPSTPTCG